MKSKAISVRKIKRKSCPNGHRACFRARCWVAPNNDPSGAEDTGRMKRKGSPRREDAGV